MGALFLHSAVQLFTSGLILQKSNVSPEHYHIINSNFPLFSLLALNNPFDETARKCLKYSSHAHGVGFQIYGRLCDYLLLCFAPRLMAINITVTHAEKKNLTFLLKLTWIHQLRRKSNLAQTQNCLILRKLDSSWIPKYTSTPHFFNTSVLKDLLRKKLQEQTFPQKAS